MKRTLAMRIASVAFALIAVVSLSAASPPAEETLEPLCDLQVITTCFTIDPIEICVPCCGCSMSPEMRFPGKDLGDQ